MNNEKASSELNTIEELVADLKAGKMILLVDDEDRENEGDLVLAADAVTPEKINFMAREARGLICLSMTTEQIDKLKLPLMVQESDNYTPNKTAFTVSIEAANGVSTGISAEDRARTIFVASRPNVQPQEIHRPGHIFPIKAQPGGVLRRAGHTEGSVDLVSLAGLNPSAVICEVMNEDGTMARLPHLKEFAKKHNIKIGSIVDLIEYRLTREKFIEEVSSQVHETPHGKITQKIFRSKLDQFEHLAFIRGEINSDNPTLVRVHVDSFARDAVESVLNKGSPWQQAVNIFLKKEPSVLLLIRGLNVNKKINIDATVDRKDYGVGAQILTQIGVGKMKLLTNRPDRKVALKGFDLEVIGTESLNS